jgi:hypothetical protein
MQALLRRVRRCCYSLAGDPQTIRVEYGNQKESRPTHKFERSRATKECMDEVMKNVGFIRKVHPGKIYIISYYVVVYTK